MRIFVNLFGLCFILIATFSKAQVKDAKSFTLSDCIDYALENNLTIKGQELVLKVGESSLMQSKMEKLPSVNASSSYGYNWGRSINPETNLVTTLEQKNGNGNISANWTIFSAGRIQNTIKQNEAILKSNEYDLEKTKNDVILNLVVSYTNVIFNRELLENARKQLESTQYQLERTEKQVIAGVLPKSTLMDMQSQFASNELNVVNAENNVNLSILQLKQALQLPASTELQIDVPEIEFEESDVTLLNVEEVYETAEISMPEVKGADNQVVSSQLGIDVAKSAFYPRLSVNAGVGTNYSSIASDRGLLSRTDDIIQQPVGYVFPDQNQLVVREVNGFEVLPYGFGRQLSDNFGQYVSVGLSVPIFNKYQTRTNVQRAKIDVERAEVQSKLVRQQLRQLIELAYNDVYAASKSYHSSIKKVEAQEESYRAMKNRFENGAANYTEYQISENVLFQAKSDLLRAKYDYVFKLKILDFYQGKTLEF